MLLCLCRRRVQVHSSIDENIGCKKSWEGPFVIEMGVINECIAGFFPIIDCFCAKSIALVGLQPLGKGLGCGDELVNILFLVFGAGGVICDPFHVWQEGGDVIDSGDSCCKDFWRFLHIFPCCVGRLDPEKVVINETHAWWQDLVWIIEFTFFNSAEGDCV